MTLRSAKFLSLFFCGILFFVGQNKSFAEQTVKDFYTSSYEQELEARKKTSADTVDAKAIHIDYRANETVIDADYIANAYALSVIDDIFTNYVIDDKFRMEITGQASPEGERANNLRLAIERASALKNYILKRYPAVDSTQITTVSLGEDWDGLKELIEQDPKVPHRKELLALLNSNQTYGSKKSKMKRIGGGKTNEYLLEYILPYLRGSVTGTIFLNNEKSYSLDQAREHMIKITDTVEVLRVDTIYIEGERLIGYLDQEWKEKEKRPFYIAVKNNLLYDLALLPNLSIEIPFGYNYNWSVGIEGNWSWWDSGAEKYNYHRIQMAGLEVRRWFFNWTGNPLNGWYAGIYGYGGTYDLRLFAKEKKDKGVLSNWSYSAGATVGYAMPIGKRFNLEFGIGLGYLGGKYHKYNVSECADDVFPRISTHQRHYFGLTKANVSLVWQIGSGFNKYR